MRFLKIYAACLVTAEVFLWFGGYRLFDFQRHPFRAFAVIAFLAAVLLSVWLSQEDRIEALEKRIQALESPEGGNDRNDKENDG